MRDCADVRFANRYADDVVHRCADVVYCYGGSAGPNVAPDLLVSLLVSLSENPSGNDVQQLSSLQPPRVGRSPLLRLPVHLLVVLLDLVVLLLYLHLQLHLLLGLPLVVEIHHRWVV